MHVGQGSLTSTSVLIKWQRPESPNGIIPYYYVRYSAHAFDSATHQRKVSGGTEVLLTGLVPFTNYSVWVNAVNVEESRRQLPSPASPMVKFTTLSDGKQLTICLVGISE